MFRKKCSALFRSEDAEVRQQEHPFFTNAHAKTRRASNRRRVSFVERMHPLSTESGLAGRMKQPGDPFTFAQLIVEGDSLLGRQDVRAHASFRQELERFGANLQALPLPS
jgi:hypothetical protein